MVDSSRENSDPEQDFSAAGLLPLVYDELRRLASSRMAREAGGHTLQPTALVHEAWLRIGVKYSGKWASREHFFNAVARTMRWLLVERARRKTALKRAGDTIELSNLEERPDEECIDSRLVLMDEIVQRLENEDPDGARIVSLKFFGGLTNAEAAEVLKVNVRTVERKWAFLKIRLFQLSTELRQAEGGSL